ncbi:tRNA pseudouridine(38-40) synthase TruA [Litorivivens sp.]|uniref:tRNA pseudouridine(38-40) synthase TruA n=1 Tax=Litorivivens sp. TaxID=2020868 RepID=UPI0035649D64
MALSYDGTSYNGWQQQHSPSMPSVQDALERALSKVANQSIKVQCAGRTDSGVHAAHQVVHFDSPVPRPEAAWVMGVNSALPDDIAVHWARPVDQQFNARFSATARRYRYVFFSAPTRPAINRQAVTWIPEALDASAMQDAAQALLGEQDFSAFRAAGCQSRTPMRNVHHAQVIQRGALTVLDIQANAFLHHMVRNIAGSLRKVGNAQESPRWIADLLAGRDRCAAAATAAPNGLYLVDVIYPSQFQLPQTGLGPDFLAPWLKA